MPSSPSLAPIGSLGPRITVIQYGELSPECLKAIHIHLSDNKGIVPGA